MFGRKKRADVGTYVDPPVAPLAPIERIVDEGALIYVSSARMTLMNHIVVGALGNHVDYEPEALREVVRAELERLAADNDDTAARLEESGTFEYESDMSAELAEQKRKDQRRRPEVHRLIADILRRCARSDVDVEQLLTQARADAIDAMFRAIQSRLLSPSTATDPHYEAERAARVSAFVELDLFAALPDPPSPAT
jgi:Mn-dependent DtxR family transcriptional regulator